MKRDMMCGPSAVPGPFRQQELAMARRRAATRGGRPLPERRVTATEAARQAINRLRAVRGSLMFVQSAGSCGWSAPMCLPSGEYLTGPGDLLLGIIADCPFYMDVRQYRAWHPGQLVIDVEPGMPAGFSLAAGEGLHFVTRTRTTEEGSSLVEPC